MTTIPKIVMTLIALAAVGIPAAADTQLTPASGLTAPDTRAAAQEPIYTPKGPIEAKYIETGPWAISTARSSMPCDRKGNLCTVIYPTKLGSNPLRREKRGFEHPVIVWANGTIDGTEVYFHILRHWASWGLVVVASDDNDTALGESTEDAATWLIAQSEEPSSTFYRKVNRHQIGVSGHSQGGFTAINLFARRPDLFKTAIPWSATTFGAGPAYGGVSVVDLTEAESGSIFFMGAMTDPLGNPTLQLVDYQALPDTVGKAIGSLTRGGHDSNLVRVTECTTPECVATRGYPTAWMMWRLQNAADGARAFVPDTGEFSRSHLQWTLAMSNGK